MSDLLDHLDELRAYLHVFWKDGHLGANAFLRWLELKLTDEARIAELEAELEDPEPMIDESRE